VRPRGWPEGTTWLDVPGAYEDHMRRAILGGPRRVSGAGTTLHEFSHALDHALGWASGSEAFTAVYDAVKEAFGSYLAPYYRHVDEFFAEALGMWMRAGGETEAERAAAMAKAVGGWDGMPERMPAAMAKVAGYFAGLTGGV
jgi:hypothetical protein